MKWSFDKTHCFCLDHGPYDLLAEILEGAHLSLKNGLAQMTNNELVDFETLCNEAGLTLPPLREKDLPGLKRIK